MKKYDFIDIVTFFARHLNHSLPEMNRDNLQPVAMNIDEQAVILYPLPNGGIEMRLFLGLLLHPVRLDKLQEMVYSNFFGINTGGCTLCIDDQGNAIYLKNTTTSSTPPDENWEWLHRILCVGKEWSKRLSVWEEFVPTTG